MVMTEIQPTTRPGRAWHIQPGDELVHGRRVLSLLGGGHRYEAYLAWDEHLHAPVVAKLLRPHLVDRPQAMEAAVREARALRALRHPSLVRLFGDALDGERPHLVLEFLDGPRLSTLLRKFGPLSAEQAVSLARQLCSALTYMANEGWVHLDLKPANIIVTSSPTLIDLSVARTSMELGEITSPVGTDAYMAPEQCLPELFGLIEARTDVWGLAVTLYKALTARPAFPPRDGVRFPQLRDDPPPMPKKAPPLLVESIEAGLRRSPTDRPTSAELYELLEPLADWSARRARRLR
jgi:serine/threonine protein kinase